MPEWLTYLSLILAVALSAFNLWDKIDAKKKALKEPTKALEARIGILETLLNVEMKQRLAEYDNHFSRDLRRIEAIEEGNKIIQKAMLALLAHAIDGNNVDQLRRAEDDLKNYLIDR